MGQRPTKTQRFKGLRAIPNWTNPRYFYVTKVGGGPEVRITAEYGSPDFERQYGEARYGDSGDPGVRRLPKSRTGSPARLELREGVERYTRSIQFGNYAKVVQRYRKSLYVNLVEAWPDALLGELTKERLIEMLEDKTPHMHRNYVNSVRAMFKHFGLPDPTAGYVYPKTPDSKGFKQWKGDAIAAFRAVHPLGGLARTIFELAYWTCQRRTDLLNMKWSDIVNVISDDGETFRAISVLSQSKTKASVLIPIDEELQEALDAWRKWVSERAVALLVNRQRHRDERGMERVLARRQADSDYILLSQRHLFRLGIDGYQNTVRKAAIASGLPVYKDGEDNVFQNRHSGHGLRKAGMAQIAEAGGGHYTIMSISGHTSTKSVDWYVQEHEKLGNAIKAKQLRRALVEKRKKQQAKPAAEVVQLRPKV